LAFSQKRVVSDIFNVAKQPWPMTGLSQFECMLDVKIKLMISEASTVDAYLIEGMHHLLSSFDVGKC
jgi:hypothetical protein